MKRLAMWFAAVAAVVLLALAFVPHAAAAIPIEDEFVYRELDDGTLEITKYNGKAQEVTVPATINGRTVTSIASSGSSEPVFAWQDNGIWQSPMTIHLPATLTNIGDYAFDHCRNLTSIEIPAGVTSIGSYAFRDCTSLASVTVPEGVVSLDREAFGDCYRLETVVLPSTLTTLPSRVFMKCRALQSVTLPAGLTSAGSQLFFGCESLQNVTLPAGLTSIEDQMFSGCTSLASITIPESVTYIGQQAFYSTALTSITIPANTEVPITVLLEEEDYEAHPVGFAYDQDAGEIAPVASFTIYGYTGSSAQTYADHYSHITFIPPDTAMGEILKGYTLSLVGDIGVNFCFELSDELAASETAYMKFTLPGGKTKEIPVSQAKKETVEHQGQTYSHYVFKCNVAAKLILSMPNYGAYAQLYFGYNTASLANAGVDPVDKDVSGVSASMIGKPYAIDSTNLPSGVTLQGAGLALETQATVVLRFETSSELSFAVAGKTNADLSVETAVEDGHSYTILRVKNIKSNELLNDVNVTVTSSAGVGTVSFCPISYCHLVVGNESACSPALVNVAKALFLYADAASSYFNN